MKTFEQLTITELHEIFKLRVDVFVVEQACAYPEVDGKDILPDTRHIMFLDDGVLAAYTRVLAPDVSYPGHSSIGRIANAESHRGMGLGHKIVAASIVACLEYWPDKDIEIGAQAHLQNFYQKHGFVTVSDEYLDDGIMHVDMVRTTLSAANVNV